MAGGAVDDVGGNTGMMGDATAATAATMLDANHWQCAPFARLGEELRRVLVDAPALELWDVLECAQRDQGGGFYRRKGSVASTPVVG